MKNQGRNRPFQRNDRKSVPKRADGYWLWGIHAVEAALSNPERRLVRLVATRNAKQKIPEGLIAQLKVDEAQPSDLDGLLPLGAVHQGLALQTEPLTTLDVSDITDCQRVVVFDQLTDPHNIGAIFRSASAFGFEAAVMQTRNVPPLTGVAAKTAAGALETVKEVRAVNIARALDELREAGFWCIGLDGGGDQLIADAVKGSPKLAIVIGAEGAGLRPAVAKACDSIASIPITSDMESLNASNAAAIAFYECSKANASA